MITARIEPVGKELTAQIKAMQAGSAALAAGARIILAQADAANREAAGAEVPRVTTVDGVATEEIGRVRDGGRIARTYDLLPLVLTEIGRELFRQSPVLTGRYQHSHRLMVDGAVVSEVSSVDWIAPALPKGARDVSFASSTYYDVLIEPHDGLPGQSRQAPEGVYHVIAVLAGALFAGLAKCAFEYRDVEGSDEPEPSIVVEAA